MDYMRLTAREAAKMTRPDQPSAVHPEVWKHVVMPMLLLEWILRHVASKAHQGFCYLDTAMGAECLLNLCDEHGIPHPSGEIMKGWLSSILMETRSGLRKRKFDCHLKSAKQRNQIKIYVRW